MLLINTYIVFLALWKALTFSSSVRELFSLGSILILQMQSSAYLINYKASKRALFKGYTPRHVISAYLKWSISIYGLFFLLCITDTCLFDFLHSKHKWPQFPFWNAMSGTYFCDFLACLPWKRSCLSTCAWRMRRKVLLAPRPTASPYDCTVFAAWKICTRGVKHVASQDTRDFSPGQIWTSPASICSLLRPSTGSSEPEWNYLKISRIFWNGNTARCLQ